jgi:hypothetical protein
MPKQKDLSVRDQVKAGLISFPVESKPHIIKSMGNMARDALLGEGYTKPKNDKKVKNSTKGSPSFTDAEIKAGYRTIK